ncbi:sensor histidine kinase [Erythrobacter colymbi]|uniref:sensor histidine kinase n=1 Tax=Erythrobacter colymbi TaxID=1161202 RepID=UPI000A35E296|nr:ATP-binding protein [Erythrobacter colymbi]
MIGEEHTGLRLHWRQLAVFVAGLIAVQLAYWLLIEPLTGADRSAAPAPLAIASTAIAPLDTPDFAAAARAPHKPVELPFTDCCKPAIFSVKMQFAVDTVPAHGLGIISTLQVDNYRLAVNGSTLFARGTVEPGAVTFDGQRTFLTRIPAGVLRPGMNELHYITVRDGFPYTDIYPPIIADYDALEAYSAKRLFFMNEYYALCAAVLGMLGLLAAIMTFRSDDWRFSAWLSALAAGFVAYMIYTLWTSPPLSGAGRMLAFFAIYLFVPTALACFVDSWTARPLRWLQPGAVAVYAVTVAVIAFHIYAVAMPEGYDRPAEIWGWYLMAAAVLVMARLVWHFATAPENRVIESVLLTVMATALVFDSISEWYPDGVVGSGNLLNSAAILLLAMTAAFLARNFRLFQSQGALNAMLQAKVTQREAELAEAALREQALVRAQAHDEERRRIMRDLHDGLGSQLMTMMLTARLGEADPPKVAEGLQGVIDEMRLMVDSMDSVGESLDAALATFRTRIQPRVESAGFAFRWSQPESLPPTSLGPRDVLQVFRIMQEAVTNALRHSGGTAITVEIAARSDGAIEVAIADDGKGGAGEADAGRGLANMRARARGVGADYALVSEPGKGTRVTLALLQPAALAAE